MFLEWQCNYHLPALGDNVFESSSISFLICNFTSEHFGYPSQLKYALKLFPVVPKKRENSTQKTRCFKLFKLLLIIIILYKNIGKPIIQKSWLLYTCIREYEFKQQLSWYGFLTMMVAHVRRWVDSMATFDIDWAQMGYINGFDGSIGIHQTWTSFIREPMMWASQTLTFTLTTTVRGRFNPFCFTNHTHLLHLVWIWFAADPENPLGPQDPPECRYCQQVLAKAH